MQEDGQQSTVISNDERAEQFEIGSWYLEDPAFQLRPEWQRSVLFLMIRLRGLDPESLGLTDPSGIGDGLIF
jgi:hypothetical protein